MTEKEKKALKDAFGIPEPDRKEEFAEQFRQRISQKPQKRIPPVVMRISACAAMLAVIIGIYAAMPSSPSDLDLTDKIISTSTTSVNNEQDKNDESMTSSVGTAVTTFTVSTSADKDSVNTATVTGTSTTDKNVQVTAKAAQSGHRPTVTTTASHTKITASKTSVSTNRTNTSHKTSTVTKHTTTTVKKTTAPTPTNTTIPASYTKAVLTTVPAPDVTPYFRDLTVTPDVIYEINGNIVNADDLIRDTEHTNNPIVPGTNDNDTVGANLPIDQKFTEMFNNSYTVVLAKIDKIVYTSINGMPYTAENVTVQNVYKGDLGTNDKLTVYVPGGYMPAGEYIRSHPYIDINDPEGITVYDNGGCNSKQEIGGSYLFFISDSDPELPYGAFSLSTKDDQSIFRKERNRFIWLPDERISVRTDFFD